MAEAVVSIVLETFRDLLVEEAKFLCGVGGQVKHLQKELERIKSFLKDADSKQHENDQIRTFVYQIRDLAYRAEDVLETYFIEVMSKRRLSFGESKIKKLLRRFACFLNEGISLHKVGMDIVDIKNDLADLRESLMSSGINPSNKDEKAKEKEEKQRLLRQTFPREDKDFVGMEDEIKELVTLVTDKTDHKVISIWGMGGSGKTTMSKKIYNHPDVKQAFDCFAWVCITQHLDIIVILKDLIKQLTNIEAHGSTSNAMVRDLMQVLQEKNCSVVLDDIWKVDDWIPLGNIISDEEGKSKLLLTTRIEEVARVGYLHKQRLLTGEEGLELLRKKALPQHRHNDPQIEEYFSDFGSEMIPKCGKLPLAISALGGILRNRVTLKEWKKIHKDTDSTLNHDLGNLGEGGAISKVLSLSYYELPNFLKPCFLYMSGFREDHLIDPKKLYHLWIAEGLVSPQYCLQGEILMDVAERFLKVLISRSMVQLDDNPDSNNWKCRLHDTMRELCVGMAKEEKFLEVWTGLTNPSLNGDAPRFFIYLLREEDITMCVDLFDQRTSKDVRSLSVHVVGDAIWMCTNLTLKVSTKNLKLLRVLDFNSCHFHEGELPSGIDRLLHLRHLTLFGCYAKELPSSVGDLPLLQTLDLRTSCKMQIPHDIFSKKRPLKHLYLREFSCELEKKLHVNGLGQLETLILNMSLANNPIELMELSKLTTIREFKIEFSGNGNDEEGSLMIEKIGKNSEVQKLNYMTWKGDH